MPKVAQTYPALASALAVADPLFWAKGKAEGDCLVYEGSRDKQGYGRVLRIAISRSPILAHRYAFILTHGEVPEGHVVMHSCDNPPCIRPDHLVLGTQADNIADRDRKGRHRPGRCHGEAHHSAKLTAEDVLDIRADDETPGWVLADRYDVTETTISNIRTRRTWKHLADEAA